MLNQIKRENLNKKIDNIALRCEKPARYVGGEYNSCNANKEHNFSFCMCFPDVYEVAMSNLGIRILYHLLNDMDKVVCERCFAPWEDFAEELKSNDIELFGLESRKPLKQFDALGFSFQYELSYTNMLLMLDLANIPFYSKDRDESHPIIIGGGPCMVNPMPIADFLDVVIVGDGEEVTKKYVQIMQKMKAENASKMQIMQAISHLDGVFIPALNNGKIVKRAVVKDLDKAYFPTKTIVPSIEVVHDRGVVELFRGCTRGCRFCQAGMIYRPVRERKMETVLKQAKEIIQNTGFEEMSLSSLSTGDYSSLYELIEKFDPFLKEKKVKLALPSLRLDSFTSKYVQDNRKSSLTFAPEAGTQRLRDVINKNITEEDFEKSLREAFKVGYDSVKLYFMIGLPTETYEDLDGIVEMAKKVKQIYASSSKNRRLRVTVSCSTFIPKPFTPFQWEGQNTIDEISEKHNYLSEKFRANKIYFNYHDVKTSVIEAVFARGDRLLSSAITLAYKNGAKFDGWTEFFNFENWMNVFKDLNIDISRYVKEQDKEMQFAWDVIDVGVSKQFLKKERENSYNGKTTNDCRKSCVGCGINKLVEGIC